MRGYIADGQSRIKFTLFQQALDHVIEEALQAADLPKVSRFGFGVRIRPDIGALQAFAVQSGKQSPKHRFDEGSTDFIRVLQDAAAHPEALSVIITDGVQDLRAGVAGQIGPGFIRTELVRVVKTKLIDQGFGIWILGVMSSFDPQDCYYNVKPDLSGRVNQCIHVERRPVYFWVIARDVETGRKFSRYVYGEMRREAAKSEKDAGELVRVLEVWPANLPHPSISMIEFRRIKDESLSMRNALSDVYRWTPAPEGGRATSACIGFAESPGGTVALPVEVNLGLDPEALAWGLPPGAWNLAPVRGDGWSSRDVRQRVKDSAATSRFIAREGPIEIPLSLRFDIAAGLGGSWIESWSTDDDTTAESLEGKTLYLRDVVAGILEEVLGNLRFDHCLHLKLVRS
jgi:hypothetical protein